MVPKVRFKGFTDEWEQVEFGHKIYRRTKSEMSSSKLPGVEYEDINSGQGTLNKDITKKSIRKRGIFFQPFDVLFGKLRPYLKNWLYPNFKGVAVGDFWVLYSKLLEPSFIYGMIQTQKFQNMANLSSGSKMPRSDWKLVSGTLFRFPMNENEQRKIGLLLLNLDKTITLHEEKQRQLERLNKALLQKMFADKTGYPALRFKGFTEKWEQVEFGQLGIISRGLTYRPNDVTDKDGVRVLRSSNIYEDSFVLNDNDVFINSSVVNVPNLKNGDILVTSANGSSHLVGKHAIIKGLSNKTVHGGFMLAIRPATNSYFLNSLMSTSWYDNFISTFVSGGNGSIGNLKKSDLERQSIFIPLNKEQNKIGQLFQSLDKTITLHDKKIQYLKQLKRGLLQKMFV